MADGIHSLLLCEAIVTVIVTLHCVTGFWDMTARRVFPQGDVFST